MWPYTVLVCGEGCICMCIQRTKSLRKRGSTASVRLLHPRSTLHGFVHRMMLNNVDIHYMPHSSGCECCSGQRRAAVIRQERHQMRRSDTVYNIPRQNVSVPAIAKALLATQRTLQHLPCCQVSVIGSGPFYINSAYLRQPKPLSARKRNPKLGVR